MVLLFNVVSSVNFNNEVLVRLAADWRTFPRKECVQHQATPFSDQQCVMYSASASQQRQAPTETSLDRGKFQKVLYISLKE